MSWLVYIFGSFPDLIRTFLGVKNWWRLPLFLIYPAPTIFHFRNGISLTFTQVFDFWVYKENLVTQEYPFKATGKSQSVIDIGGHLGTFSIFAARQSKHVTVYTFEPSPSTFRFLKDNLKFNHLDDQVKVYQEAVFDHDRGASFYVDNTSAFRSLIHQSENSGKLSVSTTTLVKIFKQFKLESCDFLKMDCEGAEYAILESTPTEIFAKIKVLALEFHQFNPDQNPMRLKTLLEKNHYQVTYSYPYSGSKSGYLYAHK